MKTYSSFIKLQFVCENTFNFYLYFNPTNSNPNNNSKRKNIFDSAENEPQRTEYTTNARNSLVCYGRSISQGVNGTPRQGRKH